jgi:hypothetical protein
LYRTMATASLRTDSPNTLAYKLGVTPNSLKRDKTVTGSVADKMAPMNMQSISSSLTAVMPMTPEKRYTRRPVKIMEIIVPRRANHKMESKL